MSPEREILQHLWAAFSSARAPLLLKKKKKRMFLDALKISFVPVCVYCFTTFHWALLTVLFAWSTQVLKDIDEITAELLPSHSHSSQKRCTSPFIVFMALHGTLSSMSISLFLSPSLFFSSLFQKCSAFVTEYIFEKARIYSDKKM